VVDTGDLAGEGEAVKENLVYIIQVCFKASCKVSHNSSDFFFPPKTGRQALEVSSA